ncbi:MAG: heme lyase CcmF/NrfE family subunit [Proteobacteria bacterium]|nr:heme lyase CcmF/NrfE family subunit [Pseudomonadota bacterium]
MLPELGQFALILALVLALLQALLPLLGAQRGIEAWMRLARPAAYAQALFVVVAFAILMHAFVAHDFSVAYVARNSNTLLPLPYCIAAVWGAHEGSLLLWILILALWTATVARFSKALPLPVIARVLGVMGVVSCGFLLFTLFTSDPFARLLPMPVEGADLNPLLQDPGLAMHPPMLYSGYVGTTVAFAFAIAAMLDGRVDARWVRWSRPWTNVAWALLTCGIALGSWWAYYVLGWGGWWFWDPVENASFMPWLAGTALLHSQAVTEKRGSFRGWTLLLAIAAFSLSLLGTFLVRSGVITSVHAFAADPSRGVFILAFLGLVIGGSLLLYALRAPRDDDGAPFALASRETLILVNNLLLTCACAMVLIGTLFPLLADALKLGRYSVGPPYFGTMFALLMAPLLLLIPFGPLTRWQREQASTPIKLLAPWFALALAGGALAFVTLPNAWWKPVAAIAIGLWLVAGTLRFVRRRLAMAGQRFTAEMLGMSLAHIGIAVFFFGVLMTESLSVQKDVAAAPGHTVQAAGYDFRFDGVRRMRGPNFIADQGTVLVSREGATVARMHPQKRQYVAGGQTMTETAIDPGLTRDLYVALGEPLDANGTWALRVYVKPWVRCIWLGALLMALGGFTAAFDRRFRRKPESAAS